MTAARHLRIVPDDGQPAAPLTAEDARGAVADLGQEHALRLFDALVAFTAAHDDPAAAVRDLQDMRRNALGVTTYIFDNVLDNYARRQRCAQ